MVPWSQVVKEESVARVVLPTAQQRGFLEYISSPLCLSATLSALLSTPVSTYPRDWSRSSPLRTRPVGVPNSTPPLTQPPCKGQGRRRDKVTGRDTTPGRLPEPGGVRTDVGPVMPEPGTTQTEPTETGPGRPEGTTDEREGT